jgi:superfamily II DNA or RNA helicase/HKD family nuclease
MGDLPEGVYERLLDEELQDVLNANPDLKAILRALDADATPHAYAQFLSQILHHALRVSKHDKRLDLVNRVIQLLAATDGLQYVEKRRLLAVGKSVLTEVGDNLPSFARPQTGISTSMLLTGQGADPPLEHELRAEMVTADRVDILVSFIKWSGLRLLLPAFENLAERNIPIRILSTSYMGASDPAAMEWLAKQNNIEVRVSYDTARTRLHAKAYLFNRNSGYSAAYIGSANMSHSAMTQGLEWTVKATAQDMPQVLDRFVAEFATYWESEEFEPFFESDFARFRKAINRSRNRSLDGVPFFAEITPRPFQLRVLEALEAARANGSIRNLVVAATGTGKTVISALDYKRFVEMSGSKPPLLFVVHRKEILEQALACFRTVLRDPNFGELLVDGLVPSEWRHVFGSVQSLRGHRPWQTLGEDHFQFVVVDEAHHGTASSYREIFENLCPKVLLGLTATPERMDRSSIRSDFDDRFAAEIRLPEALEEKLLCPFHYFGVTDNVDLAEERFWRNGRYNSSELDSFFTGDDIRAKQRLDVIVKALGRYTPELADVRGVGFCAGVEHARYMAKHFNEAGITSNLILGDTPREERVESLRGFREGKITFLFTVDVMSEGVDIPEINVVLFLRPTESLTVFLQQLGRGLRHAPGKDCLTVLDFVGQTHRKYRLDGRLSALLSRRRMRIDREVENDFPHLPPGCSIQFERVARERVLEKIRSVLNDLNHFIPETIKTWANDIGKPLTFGDFVDETGLSPIDILSKRTWSAWKASSLQQPAPTDPDLKQAGKSLVRIALRTDPELLLAIENMSEVAEPIPLYGDSKAVALHYLFWSKKSSDVGVESFEESRAKWRMNPSIVQDAAEIAKWKRQSPAYPIREIDLPFECDLKLHAAYGSAEIKAALGLATLESPGPTGTGVMHSKDLATYIHLVTFRKEERDFSPTTRYQDYPISPRLLHWESQSTTSRDSPTGQNYIHFREKGYTILFFARADKKIDGETAPFVFLGPASNLLSYSGDRPIAMTWELEYPMPAALFEEVRPV